MPDVDPAAPSTAAPRGAGGAAVVGSFALLTLIWGTTWAAIRIGLVGMPPFAGVSLRFAIASVVLFAASPLFGVRFGREPNEKKLWLVLAAFSFCGSYGVVYWCEQWVPSGLAAVLFATFPLLVALLAHFFLPAERLTWAGALGAAIGFAGVAVIFSEDFARLGGPKVRFAAAVFLLSPLVSSISYVATKKWGKGIHPMSLSAVPMAITAVVMGALSLATEGNRPISWTPTAVWTLVYLALFGSAVTFSLYYWLLSILPATRLSLMAYLIPVVAVGIGALAMHEPITLRVLAGSALVLGGVSMAGRKR